MKILLFLVTLAVVGVIAIRNQMTAIILRADVGSLRDESAEFARVRREHERLRQLQAGATVRATTPIPAATAVLSAAGTTAPVRTALAVGEWHSPAAWQHRGQDTPVAAIETALWAAAGGDLAVLQSLLHVDDDLRVKAEALRARLTDASRSAYPSVEHLLAAFAAKSLPLGDAQLVWNHQPDVDEAFACLFVRDPEYVPAPPFPESPLPVNRAEASTHAMATKEARSRENRPPMAPPNEATRAFYVVLRRTDAHWRFVVSPGAVDKIAKEIAGAPAH